LGRQEACCQISLAIRVRRIGRREQIAALRFGHPDKVPFKSGQPSVMQAVTVAELMKVDRRVRLGAVSQLRIPIIALRSAGVNLSLPGI
jgi:hypothetical protein